MGRRSWRTSPQPCEHAAVWRRPFAHGVFCGFSSLRFICFEAPIVAGTSVLPVPKYAFAGPGGVLPLLASLLAPPGPPLPALDVPVPPPPAANAKLGIKTSATMAKDLRVPSSREVGRGMCTIRARREDVARSRHAGLVRSSQRSALNCAVSPVTNRDRRTATRSARRPRPAALPYRARAHRHRGARRMRRSKYRPRQETPVHHR